ncbi:MAG: cysteine--tRNA ligase [Nanohaloarchaea archaeon SW_4_43_9]|nr:MAG: cysteine--tRNA ligase [Nanohaloarchaea archaeon SW_4_43_9]
MSLKLFNTLTREKEEFEPIEEGRVKFYSCGQTIYDDLHIGNARHVQNITDVGHLTDDGDQGEDKVEKRAEDLGMEPMELVEDQIERYFEDTKAINVERQDIVPRATGHINEMINYVQKIIDNGYAYEAEGNIYFDVEKFAEDYPYGEMAKKDIEQLKQEAESRVEPDEKKKNQYDFALWLNAEGTGHLMKWNAEFDNDRERIESTGYPGWHLECSVMGQKYLGEEFDIHAGGKDHIFPHHPNERAQSFAATGKGQARYWLHNEFIQIEGEKMSKSEGNFYTVRGLLNGGYSGDAIRLYLVSSHYRSETDFSKEGLEKAEKELRKARRARNWAEKVSGDALEDRAEEVEDQFKKYMDDDLDTANAKQLLMEFVSDITSTLESGEGVSIKTRNILEELFEIIGINLVADGTVEEMKLAELLAESREKFREKENYEEADRIRDELEKLGFEVEDTDDEPRLYRSK